MKDEVVAVITIDNKKFEFTDMKKLAYFVQDTIKEIEDGFEIETTLLERERALEIIELKKEIFSLKKQLKNEKRN